MRVQFGDLEGLIRDVKYADTSLGTMGLVVAYPSRACEGAVTVTLSNSLKQKAVGQFVYRPSSSLVLPSSRCITNCLVQGNASQFVVAHGSIAKLQLDIEWPPLVGFETRVVAKFDNSIGTVLSIDASTGTTKFAVLLSTPPMPTLEVIGTTEVDAKLVIPTGQMLAFQFSVVPSLRASAAAFDDIYSSITVVFNVDVSVPEDTSCRDILAPSSLEMLGGGSQIGENPHCSWISDAQLHINLVPGFLLQTGNTLHFRELTSSDGLSTTAPSIAVIDSPTSTV